MKIIKFLLITIAVFIMATLPSCGGGGGGNGGEGDATTVYGTVLDIFGNPISGAQVTITSDPVTVTTDSNGNFSAKVTVGDHSIKITMDSQVIYSGSFTCYEDTPYDFGNIHTSYDGTIVSPSLTTITLTPDAGTGNNELINLGIPFPKGVLSHSSNVRILDEQGAEVAAYVADTIKWHSDGSVRAVKVQFFADMSSGLKIYSFDTTQPRTINLQEQPYNNGTTPAKESFRIPRVLATLTPEWLTGSMIAGHQTILDSTNYDNYIKSQWQWAKDTSYTEYSNWLLDRVSTITKLYIRSGNPEYLKEAFNSYRFYMDKIKTSGTPGWPDCAGGWEYLDKSPCDSKYVYIEPVLLMLALTGDDTQHDVTKIDLMVRAWETGGWSYPLEPYSSADTPITERTLGLRLQAFADSYELTGNPDYLALMNTAVDYLYDHQTANPDGFLNDGCWRHSWALHEGVTYPGNVADDRRCSSWMTAMIIGSLYKAYEITNDSRILEMVQRFGDFMENYGWIPQSWWDHPDAQSWKHGCQDGGGTISGYSSSSVASVSALVATQNSEGWYSDMHNPELLLPVAWAWSLETDPLKKQALADRIILIENWFNPNCASESGTPRAFNWQNRYGSLSQWILANN
jgi:hypothetical protein